MTWQIYAGDGTTAAKRGVVLTPPIGLDALGKAEGYLADPGLADAVNVSLALGQPLLVTGEPGTGKTQLAHSIAYDLQLPGPFVFNTKTTSVARDLFYRYDALRHFQDAQLKREDEARPNISSYIEFGAFGKAIYFAMQPAERAVLAGWNLPELKPGEPGKRSVVLIDEIDKAPRDLPNDVLNELEEMAFEVKEAPGIRPKADRSLRPIVVLTSNSEKNLPDAFLRRCVFYHIGFPDDKALERIVALRLGSLFAEEAGAAVVTSAIKHFMEIRDDKRDLKKKPATAELLGWLTILQQRKLRVDNLTPDTAKKLGDTYSALVKQDKDVEKLKTWLTDEWLPSHRAVGGA